MNIINIKNIELKNLKNLILSGEVLSKNIFIIDDLDLIIDSREEIDFDNQWMRNYNYINEKIYLIDSELKALIESIREVSYKITYSATKSSDLAAYISDDFGLIAEALVLNYNDNWLNALAESYSKNKIPCGNLKLSQHKLKEIFL